MLNAQQRHIAQGFDCANAAAKHSNPQLRSQFGYQRFNGLKRFVKSALVPSTLPALHDFSSGAVRL